MLGLGFPTLREGEGRKAIKEAEGLHLGLLSSRDGQFMLVLVAGLGFLLIRIGGLGLGLGGLRLRLRARVG
jgi:hypothetical protein